jgi:hypothetical protein
MDGLAMSEDVSNTHIPMTVFLTIRDIRTLPEPQTLPEPNASGAVFGPTPGISRNMQATLQPPPVLFDAPGTLQGGGDLNGTQATSILMHQAGTNASRWQMPRLFAHSGNWCGIV